jgi:predicted nucleic acid-binding protein
VVGLVLDCSVAASWFFENESEDYTDRCLEAVAQHGAAVPALWPAEVVNVLQAALRRKRLTALECEDAIAMLNRLSIERDAPLSAEALAPLFRIASAYGLTAYDASYLHLATAKDLPLATKDEKLRAAARSAGVPLFAA